MSVDAVSDTYWQTARGTIRERCEAVFNQELLSDVKFEVRDSRGGSKTIPAHKFMLAISSPVFFAMFYGKAAEMKDSVEISDCEYESLLELFRFIYSDKAKLNADNVMQLLYLSKKYMLPTLAEKCSAFLKENLNALNVFHILPDAQKYEEKDLMNHCWKLIETQTEEAVKSEGFVTVEKSVLEELVEKNSLHIKEVELFKVIDCWAEKELWDTYWQTARGTIRERCEAVFNQELLSDVKFVVPDSRGGSKTIPAHKFMLAISSPVFFAMFYGKAAEIKDSVEISDCEYESLLEFFRFIYSDKLNLNADNKCSAFLKENLNALNVFHILPDAQKYEEKDLMNHCWKMIATQTEEAVKSEGFVTVERSVLEELVEKNSLNIKEVDLFKAVDCWAENKCKKQGLVAEGSVKRRVLGERVVQGIRFPLMEETEFADIVLDSEILTLKETNRLVKYFNSVLHDSVGFLETERTEGKQVISRFRSLAGGLHYGETSNCICFDVDKNIHLHAIHFFGSDNSQYSVKLEVSEYNSGISVRRQEGFFLSKQVHCEIGDHQGFDILFKPPIAITANTRYKISASITGPPYCYGTNGCSTVEKSGVTFHFFPFSHPTSNGKGQLPKFVFTLD
ncbi:unnamed protein product [Porites evermanni]|uniref:BTB domain-containing protein n=1 Tax=Porites evermanni TaxID=104178 RepID=A0ABN8RXF2_9CNID|nr:unnamed protein product [Porites evermanni]